MTELNDRIREALRADDDDALAGLADEPDIFEQVLQTFRGRSRALVLLTIGVGTACMVLAIVCIVQFFGATEVQTMLAWLGGFGFSLSAVMGLKIWYWMELQKNAITREIKRLELQIARLAKKG